MDSIKFAKDRMCVYVCKLKMNTIEKKYSKKIRNYFYNHETEYCIGNYIISDFFGMLQTILSRNRNTG